jgi:hypothetical protein
MRAPQPKFQDHSIVLLGNLNPMIFQPAWFSAEGLIKKIEAEKASVQIIHPDVVIFSLEWLRLEITKERFVARTTQEPYDEPLRDLVIGTFSLLRHTPILKMGINRSMHFLIENEEKWHAAGYKLAPKEPWEGIIKRSGLLSLTIQEDENKDGEIIRFDGLRGFTRVRVEPSGQIRPGLFIEINNHFEARDTSPSAGCTEILKILKQSWVTSYSRSEEVIYSLLERLLQ